MNLHKTILSILPNFFIFSQKGFCPCCQKKTIFYARNTWVRNHLICLNCGSIPRERAITKILRDRIPDFKKLIIHESSPVDRGLSTVLKKECAHYIPTQFFPGAPQGDFVKGFRNENLENQTFKDDSFDIVVTQDVLEHLYNPDKAFAEIKRTLKPGGVHIFTVPFLNRNAKTEIWAKPDKDGNPIFLYEAEYHGNPIDSNGAPVTMHWGYDLIDYIEKSCGMKTSIINIYDLNLGICGEFREVCISTKE